MKKFLMTLAMMTLVVGCSNKDSNDRTAPATVVTSNYQLINGSCYVTGTNQQVAANYCTTTTNTGYQLYNGLCYSTATQQQVDANYCSTTTNGTTGYQLYNGLCYSTTTNQQVAVNYCSATGTGTGTSQACYGAYYYQGQYGQCYGSNCSGYTMTQVSTGTQVYCQ